MKFITALTLLCCSTLFAAPKSDSDRKSYEETKRQTSVADEALFLEPHIQGDVNELAGKIVLDAGVGSAHRALDYSEQGAQICTMEPESEQLIPYDDNLFDRAISVNIGAALPSTIHIISNNEFLMEGLGVHCHELARVLKEDGEATLVAPGSYGTLFVGGSSSEAAALRHIKKVLTSLKENTPEEIAKQLATLTEVNRATFAVRGGALTLVTDEEDLSLGEQIWRKEGDKVYPGYFHSVEEYLVALNNAGLQCTEIKRPCFFGKVKYNLYHQALEESDDSLGQGYIDNNPFTIYSVIKKQELR